MKRMICLGGTLLMLLCLFPFQLQAEETIEWVRLDFPPFEINEGVFANKGIVNLFKQLVQANLTSYQHGDAGLMNGERLMASFTSSNLCHPAVLRNPALEGTTYLSVGIGIMPAPAIITTKQAYAAKFNGQTQVSLQQMITREDVVLGISTLSVDPILDPIIAQHAQQANIYTRKASEIEGMFKMLREGRIDYTIGYPAEAIFWQSQYPDLVVVPLEETAGQYTIGRVACTKNDWGRAIIEQVNHFLLDQRLQEAYISAVFLPWIPEEMKASYLSDYQRILSEDTWTNAN